MIDINLRQQLAISTSDVNEAIPWSIASSEPAELFASEAYQGIAMDDIA